MNWQSSCAVNRPFKHGNLLYTVKTSLLQEMREECDQVYHSQLSKALDLAHVIRRPGVRRAGAALLTWCFPQRAPKGSLTAGWLLAAGAGAPKRPPGAAAIRGGCTPIWAGGRKGTRGVGPKAPPTIAPPGAAPQGAPPVTGIGATTAAVPTACIATHAHYFQRHPVCREHRESSSFWTFGFVRQRTWSLYITNRACPRAVSF